MRKKIMPLACLIFLAACTNSNEIGSAKDVDPDAIYYDYNISGSEEGGEVTVNLQYRFGGSAGTTLVLDAPAGVTLDGRPMPVDSSNLTGAYYLLRIPAAGFAGTHSIVFTDKTGKTHTEEFTYQPFTLPAEVPPRVARGPLTLELANYNSSAAAMRVVLTDTSFISADFNEVVAVKNGRLTLDSNQWRTVVDGPITIELYREEDRPLRNASKEGGRLQQMYSLRREFVLSDSKR